MHNSFFPAFLHDGYKIIAYRHNYIPSITNPSLSLSEVLFLPPSSHTHTHTNEGRHKCMTHASTNKSSARLVSDADGQVCRFVQSPLTHLLITRPLSLDHYANKEPRSHSWWGSELHANASGHLVATEEKVLKRHFKLYGHLIDPNPGYVKRKKYILNWKIIINIHY